MWAALTINEEEENNFEDGLDKNITLWNSLNMDIDKKLHVHMG